jgi:hypothetical protein
MRLIIAGRMSRPGVTDKLLNISDKPCGQVSLGIRHAIIPYITVALLPM